MWLTKQRQEGLKMSSPKNNSVLMGFSTPICQNCVLIWSPWESTTVFPFTAVGIKMRFWNFTQLKNRNKTYIWETFICQKHSSCGVCIEDNDILPHGMQAEKLCKEGITHCEEEKFRFSSMCKANLLLQYFKKSSFHGGHSCPFAQWRTLKTKPTQVTTTTSCMDLCMCMHKCICTECEMPLPKIGCDFWLGKAG